MYKITESLLVKYNALERDIEIFKKRFPHGADYFEVLNNGCSVDFAFWIVNNLPATNEVLTINSTIPRKVFYNGDVVINTETFDFTNTIYISGNLTFNKSVYFEDINIKASKIKSGKLTILAKNASFLHAEQIDSKELILKNTNTVHISTINVEKKLSLFGKSFLCGNKITCNNEIAMNDNSVISGDYVTSKYIEMYDKSKILARQTIADCGIDLCNRAIISSNIYAPNVVLNSDSFVSGQITAAVLQN